MTVLSRERVHAIYDAFSQGRLDLLVDAFDPDVDFLSHAPTEVFPYLGRRRGRDEVLAAIAQLHREVEVLSFVPVTTLIDGDDAALSVAVLIRHRQSGRLANFLAAHFMRFRNNRISQYCAIVDSLEAIEQLLATRVALDDRD